MIIYGPRDLHGRPEPAFLQAQGVVSEALWAHRTGD